MADNYREQTTRKRGRSASKLSVRLFLLDPDKNVTKVTKEIGSEKGINELKEKGYGPPSKEYCVAGDKVGFALELTNEEFKQKLVEIYPSLKNACFVFMTAGKDNTLKELNRGVCCYRCYTPDNVYSSERGQGRLYIQIISENQISQCTHGVSLLERLRSRVGGSQPLFVPIQPKPVATVVPAGIGATNNTAAATPVAMPTNNQSSVSGSLQTESRNFSNNFPVLDLSSLRIGVAQADSTPASQNSGNIFGTLLPSPRVNLFAKPTGQGPSSISAAAATTPETRSSDNTAAQRQLPVSSIVVSQPATTPWSAAVSTNSLLPPIQRFPSSVHMTPQGQLPASATVSQTGMTPSVNGSNFNTLSNRQIATNSLSQPSQPLNNSAQMVPPEQIGPSARNMTGPVLPFASGYMTPAESQVPRPTEIFYESVPRFLFNIFSQQGLEAADTASPVSNEAIRELYGPSGVSNAVVAQRSSRITPSPGLNLLSDVVGEAQREQYEHSITNGSGMQVNLGPEAQTEPHIDEFVRNVESTGKLEISLDVLNDDPLMKKLNESAFSIHTVEIQSTCEVHQVLEKFTLKPSLKVLRIRENSLNFEDVNALLEYLYSVNNLYELDLYRTKFREGSFSNFLAAFHCCKDLTSLTLTDNSLTDEEITRLVTVFKSVKNLKVLNLSKCLLDETHANAILQKHEQAKNIVSLNLSQTALQGNEIVVGICQLQSLEELDLSHNCVRFSPLPNLEGKRNHLSTCTKVISLSSNHMKPEDISQFRSLIRSDLLELNLDFNHVGGSIWSLCSLGERIKHLKVLSLANTDICNNVDGLAYLLSLVSELEDLNLSSNNNLVEDFQQLQKPLSKLAQLKRLNLSMNVFSPDGLKVLADVLKDLPLLEWLDMSCSYIREDEASVLCKSLVSLKKLKYLNLSGNIIDVEVLNDALDLPPSLEELLFSGISHGEKLFAKMRQLRNLRKLHLDKLVLRDCDVRALACTLPSFQELEELSLTGLAPECETILTAIKHLKNIRKIDLTSIELSNESALVDMLSSLTSLEELVLDDMIMSYTRAGYGKLFGAIKLLKHLRKLSLGGVELPEDSVKAFCDMFLSLSMLEDIVFPRVFPMRSNLISGCFDALESLKHVRSLDLRGIGNCESRSGGLARVLPSLQLLEKLELNLGVSSSDSTEELFSAFAKLKYLKKLSFSYISCEEIVLNALAEVLLSLQQLTEVKLPFSNHAPVLFNKIGKLRCLKELVFLGCVNNFQVKVFAHALSELKLLEKLEFTTDELLNNVEQLYAALGKLKYLRILDLTFLGITDCEVSALAKALPSLELLEDLRLEWGIGRRASSEHMGQVFVAISKLRYLKKLDLNWDVVNHTDQESLAKTLSSLWLLEKLRITEIECKCGELLIAVGKAKYLKKLDLCWGKISRTDVNALVQVLASLRVLEELELWFDFICYHKCDELKDCKDNECAHKCPYECCHDECDGGSNDACDHDHYDRECSKCDDDEPNNILHVVAGEVLDTVKKLKYFKRFEFNERRRIIGTSA